MTARLRVLRSLAPISTQARRVVLAAILLLASSASCHAGLILQVNDIVTKPGAMGVFDVLLINTDPSESFRVAGDSFQLALTGIGGVQFTSASISTAAPYIYSTSGTTIAPTSPLSFDSFPTTSFLASDAEFGSLGYRLVAPGATFGLARVTFSVSPSASGVGLISFLDLGSGTSLADENGNALAFETRGGTFTVTPANVVPEPGSVTLLGLGLIALSPVVRHYRSRPSLS